MLSLIVPKADGAAALAACLVLFVGCAALGALAGPTGRRLAAADPMVGLGGASVALTVLGTLSRAPLALWGALVGAAALGALAQAGLRRRRLGGRGQWIALAVLAPLLLIAAAAPATQWDDFMHWLPNAAFLFRYESFPRPDLQPPVSAWPAYPYTMPLWIELASHLAGRFVENAGALFNLLLLAAFVPVLIAIVDKGSRAARPAGAPPLSGRAVAALGAVGAPLVTLLGPSFDKGFALSAYADVATAVMTATAGVLGCLALGRLAEEDEGAARTLAWQFGFVAAALLNLKQANLVLFVLILAGLALVAWTAFRQRRAALLRLAPAMLLPGAAVYAAWRLYVAWAIPGGETTFLPLAAWHTSIIPEILAAMGRQMAEHPAHFVLMFGLSALGVRALARTRDLADRLLALVAVVWLGYTGFLAFTYVATFSDFESRAASQYWRYSTHVGLLGTAAAAALIARRWPLATVRWPAAAAALGLGCVAFPLGVVLLAPAISPDTLPLERAFREIGRDLADTLPDGARVAVIDAQGWGLMTFALRYDLWRPGREDRGLRVVKAMNMVFSRRADDLRSLPTAFDDPALTHLVVNDPLPEYASLLGIQPAARQAFLLERGEAGWVVARSWVRRPGRGGNTE